MCTRRLRSVFLGLLVCIVSCSVAGQTPPIVCQGKVVNAEGKAIPNARLVLYHSCSRWGLGNRVAQEAASGLDGAFAFKDPLQYSDPSKYPYGRDSYVLLAVHPDHALGWCNISKGQEKSSLAVAFNNRCYAKMKLEKLEEALSDCTTSLKYGNLPDAYQKHQELAKRLGLAQQSTL